MWCILHLMTINHPATQRSKLSRDLPLSAFTKSFKPLHDRVALRRHPKDSRAAPGSLLVRPESKLKNSDRATVLAMGPGCRVLRAEGVKVGDVVVISTFADGDRDWGGESLLIIPEGEIMALEEPAPSPSVT